MSKIYYVENMECANCKEILTNALSGMNGVSHVTAKLKNKTIAVDADITKTSDAEIIATINRYNYTAIRISG